MEHLNTFTRKNWKDFLCFDVFFTLFIFTLPFANAYMYPFIALSFIYFIVEKKYKQISFKQNWPLISFGSLLVLLYLQGVFYQTLLEDFRLHSKLFLIFFLLLFTLSYGWRGNGKLGEKAFVLGVCVSILISTTSILIFWIQHQNLPLSSGSQVNQLLAINRPYLGIFVVTSLFIFLKNIRLKLWSKKLYLVALIMLSFLIFISARLAILLSLFVVSIHFINLFKQNKKKLVLFLLGSLGVISVSIFNPIMLKRFKIDDGFKIDLERTLDFEPRYVIYPCNYDIFKKGIPFFGFSGERELQSKLNHCYTENIEKEGKLAYFIREEFHTHNAFVNITFQGGWIALLLFTFITTYPFFGKKYTYETKLMLFLVVCFLMVENVMHTKHGSTFFGLFAMFYFPNIQKKIRNT